VKKKCQQGVRLAKIREIPLTLAICTNRGATLDRDIAAIEQMAAQRDGCSPS
jgi:hypothetical protein